MNYLKYIEFSAENLQFYLWFRDYSARFEQLPGSERALSPEWTRAQAEAEAAGNTSSTKPSKNIDPQVAHVLKGTDFENGKPKPTVDKADPFNTPDKTPSLEEKRDVMSDYGSSTADERTMLSSSTAYKDVAEHAFEDAGMKWKPCMFSSQMSSRLLH